MKLTDALGDITMYPEETVAFIGNWFHPGELINISAMRAGANVPPMTRTFTYEELMAFTAEDLHNLTYEDNGSKYNLYFQVAPTSKPINIADRDRGKEVDVSRIPGVWADLDVKDNAFASKKDIWDFLFSLDIWPSQVVGSPSGGIHAYWRFPQDETGAKELLDRWWAYLDEKAGPDRRIDKLIDTARILRIPGTLYFPKAGSEALCGAMRLLYNSEQTCTPDQISRTAEVAYRVKTETRRVVVEKDVQRRMELKLDANGDLPVWQKLQTIAHLEDDINAHLNWADILPRHGWTFLRTDGEGCRIWARPGRSDKSATTDYQESAVMSLFSSAVETGLSDLYDAGVALTKYRVVLRLDFNDDEQAMVEYYAQTGLIQALHAS